MPNALQFEQQLDLFAQETLEHRLTAASDVIKIERLKLGHLLADESE